MKLDVITSHNNFFYLKLQTQFVRKGREFIMEKSMKKQKNSEKLLEIDGLGRIYLPLEEREKLQIKPRDMLEVYRSGRNIILKKTNIRTEKNTIQEINLILNNKTEINIKINDLICDMGKYQNSKHKIRTLDELGKILIPIEARNELKIKEKDKFKPYIKDDMIILIKKESKYNNGKRKSAYNNKWKKQNCHR